MGRIGKETKKRQTADIKRNTKVEVTEGNGGQQKQGETTEKREKKQRKQL